MFHRFLSIILFSALTGLLAAGAELAASARWAARVARYLEHDRMKPPSLGAVVFAGSSSIDMWRTLAEDFPGITTVNRGIGGTWLADLPEFADQLVLPLRPKILVVYAGENDLHDGRSVDSVVAAFDRVRAQFFSAEPGSRLVFLALKPSPRRRALLPLMREANARIEAACRTDRRCTFVDVFTPMLDAAGAPREELFSTDQLHLNAAGYRLWTTLVSPMLVER